jgi:hypothetical protein
MQRKLASPYTRRAAATVFAAAVVLVVRGRARADAPRPPIVLVLDPCAAVDAEEVRRLVPIEMGAPLAPAAGDGADAAGPGGTTHVFVGCVPGSPQLVRLEVRDPENGRRVDRVITLVGDSKTDQARLVAIVAVELVATSRTELREAPSAATPAPDARALAVAVTPAPVPPAARWRALALGSLRHFAGLPRLLPGGGLGVERASPRGFAVALDVLAEGGAAPTALGDVDTFIGSLGALVAWRVDRGRLGGELGAGGRVGLARLAGEAPRGATGSVQLLTQTAPWAGPLVAARAQAALGQRVVLSLGGELGYVTSAVVGHVTGQSDLAVSGSWWNLVLGVGYAR